MHIPLFISSFPALRLFQFDAVHELAAILEFRGILCIPSCIVLIFLCTVFGQIFKQSRIPQYTHIDPCIPITYPCSIQCIPTQPYMPPYTCGSILMCAPVYPYPYIPICNLMKLLCTNKVFHSIP